MKRLANTGRISLPISFAIALMVWEGLVYVFKTPDYLMPAPSKVFTALVESFPLLMRHGAVTLLEVVSGFLSALILSAGMSLLMVRYKLMYDILWPYMVISQTIPLYVLAPLFMVWFGFGILPKVLIVVLVCFSRLPLDLFRGSHQQSLSLMSF